MFFFFEIFKKKEFCVLILIRAGVKKLDNIIFLNLSSFFLSEIEFSALKNLEYFQIWILIIKKNFFANN